VRCLLCSDDAEEPHWKFCKKCKEKYDVDTYSIPLLSVAYHLLIIWEVLKVKRRDDTLTDEELELIRDNSVRWRDIQRKIDGEDS
jgi:hypothetical protein